MTRIASLVLALACFFALPSLGRGEPTPSVRWLMNEPATLFDIGMMRLREFNRLVWNVDLRAKMAKKNLTLAPQDQGIGAVVYNWDENTIYIESAFYGRPSEALCVEVLELFKDTISPDWRKPGGSTGLPANLLGVFFDHVNATSKKRPTDLDENLFRVFVASVGLSETPTEQTVGGLKFVHSKNSIYCKSRIPDPTPTFTKFGTVPQR